MSRVSKKLCPNVYCGIHKTIRHLKLPLVQSTQRFHLGSQNLTLVVKQGPLFPWKNMQIHVYTWSGEQEDLNHILVTKKSRKPPSSPSCYGPLRATCPYLSKKSLQDIPTYMAGIKRVWDVMSDPSGSARNWKAEEAARPIKKLHFMSHTCAADRSNWKERDKAVWQQLQRKPEQMLSLTGMQPKQTNSRCWMDSPVARQRDTGHSLEPTLNFS